MVWTDRGRCMCVVTDSWWSYTEEHHRKEVDEFIRQYGQRALSIRNTPGILENRTKENLQKLSSGLDIWGYLKTLDVAKLEPMYLRVEMQEVIPFKLKECQCTSACCGTCTRWCVLRCVPDMLYRLGEYLYEPYMGFRDPTFVEQAVMKEFFNPRTNYDTIVNCLYGVWKEEFYDYRQDTEKVIDKRGKLKPLANPETGEFRIINWPESGLCPYCFPKLLASKPRGNYNRY